MTQADERRMYRPTKRTKRWYTFIGALGIVTALWALLVAMVWTMIGVLTNVWLGSAYPPGTLHRKALHRLVIRRLRICQ